MASLSQRWVVVEAESLPWFMGGRSGGGEPAALAHLQQAGFKTYWMHYRDVWARPRMGNSRPRKPITVKRGYFPPWIFVAVDASSRKRIADDVARIKKTRYVAEVLWSETDPHYLPALGYCACGDRCIVHRKKLCPECNWLDWAKSVRIDPKTGIVEEPVPIDPDAGLFESPPDLTSVGLAAQFKQGDRVRTTGKWARFEEMTGCRSVVESIGSDGTVNVTHVQMFGTDHTEAYDPLQVEKLQTPTY